MRIPSKLKVAGQTYQIIQNYNFIESAELIGQADHHLGEIRLKLKDYSGKNMARDKIEKTFIHELLHCINNHYNASKLDEENIERIGSGLYQVLKDNGLLK